MLAEVAAQLVKPTRMPLKYPYIICSSFEHYALDGLRNEEVQNMFWTKPTTIAIVVAKNPKFDNVPINVVIVVTTHRQVPK